MFVVCVCQLPHGLACQSVAIRSHADGTSQGAADGAYLWVSYGGFTDGSNGPRPDLVLKVLQPLLDCFQNLPEMPSTDTKRLRVARTEGV